jgi:hypothetical protein
MASRYNQAGTVRGTVRPYKPGRCVPIVTKHLHEEETAPTGGIPARNRKEPVTVDFCQAKTVRDFGLVYILVKAYILVRSYILVGAYILIGAYILVSTYILIGAYILSTFMFLSPPIFCPRLCFSRRLYYIWYLYFVDAYLKSKSKKVLAFIYRYSTFSFYLVTSYFF